MPNEEFRILIASDVHLGYVEKDPIRGDDSFNAFEEVLQIAVREKVDFLLLGGDLFHENKPSSRVLTRCVDLLRKYTLGDGQIRFQIVSDQAVNFAHSSAFKRANYEDANLNVKLPVFSIHGNHDDPNTKDAVSVLDTLAAAGLINYFGKQSNIDAVQVSPVLIEKSDLKLALYGIGSLPEERFHRHIAGGRVQFLAMEQPEEWFKIFVIHQNRVKHGSKYLPENCLTSLPDFVVWGHEHESFTKADFNSQQGFYVYQPGSTVATSLCPSEAAPKHVGVLHLQRDTAGDFRIKLDAIRLLTVRQFYFNVIDLDSYFISIKKTNPSASDVEERCIELIEQILETAKKEHNKIQPPLPLIRLRLDCSNMALAISANHFAQNMVGQVANPKDVILFKTRRQATANKQVDMDLQLIDELTDDAKFTQICKIDDVIREYFDQVDSSSQLDFLYEKLLTECVRDYVEKDVCKMQSVIDWHLKEVQTKFTDTGVKLDKVLQDPHLVREMVQDFKEQLKLEDEENMKKIRKLLKMDNLKDAKSPKTATTRKKTTKSQQDDSSDGEEVFDLSILDEDMEDDEPQVKIPTGRGKGRGRGSRGGARGGARGRATTNAAGSKSISDYMIFKR